MNAGMALVFKALEKFQNALSQGSDKIFSQKSEVGIQIDSSAVVFSRNDVGAKEWPLVQVHFIMFDDGLDLFQVLLCLFFYVNTRGSQSIKRSWQERNEHGSFLHRAGREDTYKVLEEGDDVANVFWILVSNMRGGLSDHPYHISWQADFEEFGILQYAQNMENAVAVHFGTASLPKNLADELKEAGLHKRMRQELLQFIIGMPLLVPPSLMRVPANSPKPLFSLPMRNRMVVGPRMPSGLHEFIDIVLIYYQPSHKEVWGEGGDIPSTHRKANIILWLKLNLPSLICRTFHK
eukprot:bmy_02927T0